MRRRRRRRRVSDEPTYCTNTTALQIISSQLRRKAPTYRGYLVTSAAAIEITVYSSTKYKVNRQTEGFSADCPLRVSQQSMLPLPVASEPVKAGAICAQQQYSDLPAPEGP